MTKPDAVVTDLTQGVYRRQYSNFVMGQRINALSIPAEAWFWRVHAIVDDFGNYHGDPIFVHAATAGLRIRTVGARQVGKWVGEMEQRGLIRFYDVGGERFLHVEGFCARQPGGKN